MMPPVLEFQRVNLSHFGCSHSFVIPNYIGSRFLICFFLFSTHHKGCHRSEISVIIYLPKVYITLNLFQNTIEILPICTAHSNTLKERWIGLYDVDIHEVDWSGLGNVHIICLGDWKTKKSTNARKIVFFFCFF